MCAQEERRILKKAYLQHMHTHLRARAFTHSHTNARAHTHKHAYTCTHTYTQTHTHTHTRAYTHTHIPQHAKYTQNMLSFSLSRFIFPSLSRFFSHCLSFSPSYFTLLTQYTDFLDPWRRSRPSQFMSQKYQTPFLQQVIVYFVFDATSWICFSFHRRDHMCRVSRLERTHENVRHMKLTHHKAKSHVWDIMQIWCSLILILDFSF